MNRWVQSDPVLIAATGIIALGLVPAPLDLHSAPGLGLALLSMLPLLLALLRAATSRRLPPWLSTILMIGITGLGVAITMLSAIVGAGSNLTIANGLILILGITAMVRHLERAGQCRTAFKGLAIAAFGAVWSLGAGLAAGIGAVTLAGDAPYCLATQSLAGPVQSLAALRGLSFYTNQSGYKSTSHWFFHGILIVADPQGDTYYNWSPRHLRFEGLSNPDRQIASPLHICTPIPGFGQTLPLWSQVPGSPDAATML